jgi:hypothetical protein
MKASQARTGGRHIAIERGLLKNAPDWPIKSRKRRRPKRKSKT